jgi:hypothetical protein
MICRQCDKEFDGTSNQVYCSADCRTQATKEAAIARKEERRRLRRKKASKNCIVCGAKLSMYGYGNTCDIHSNPKSLSPLLKKIRDYHENNNARH